MAHLFLCVAWELNMDNLHESHRYC
jgi:hypothetical protein